MSYPDIKNPRLVSEVTNEELKRIKAYSKRIGLNVSCFVRMICLERLEKNGGNN